MGKCWVEWLRFGQFFIEFLSSAGEPVVAVMNDVHAASRRTISSGSPWEPLVGYSRAVRIGNLICVAGTTAVDDEGKVVGEGDAAEQTRYIIGKIERALNRAGGGLQDVVRTRMYVTDIDRWEEIGRVHGEFFGAIRPASTMVEVRRLIDPALLVEIEADALLIDAIIEK